MPGLGASLHPFVTGYDGPRRTVLIADDNWENRSVLRQLLTPLGFTVIEAINGQTAVDLAISQQPDRTRPDLILLDVMMPGMDGFETCRRLKHDPITGSIPVMFMTALSETIDKVNGFNMGAVDYITKPFQLKEVLFHLLL